MFGRARASRAISPNSIFSLRLPAYAIRGRGIPQADRERDLRKARSYASASAPFGTIAVLPTAASPSAAAIRA
jgi:hypothetical protein